MPFLQSSGAISLNNIKTLFGGPTSPSLSNYYRGGSYIPSTKTVVVREPASGDYYDKNQTRVTTYYSGSNYNTNFRWGNSDVSGSISGDVVTYSTGGYTYQRSSIRESAIDGYGVGFRFYGIYRTSNSTVNINTSIPTSGTISMSQFYGAEKP